MRKLSFITVFLLILRKSVKSLQLVLNEFVVETAQDFMVTASALSQARQKLKHTAYVELNEDILGIYYQDNDIQRFQSYRLLAVDGSKVILPPSPSIREAFGTRAFGNHTGKQLGDYTRTTFEACYDVLNHMAVSCRLGQCEDYEVNLAQAMLDTFQRDDLLIFDRGYASYEWMATLLKNHKNFIIRCPKTCFRGVKALLADSSAIDKVVEIDVPAQQAKRLRLAGLPEKIKVRFIKITLSTGEWEILATSLLDSPSLSLEDFKQLYGLRWGVETFFAKLKGRLNLENFTGKSVESVLQDFWSTIFISNLESIVTEDVESHLNEKPVSGQAHWQVNRAVSFNAIKKMAFELFFSEFEQDTVMMKLEQLFTMNPVLIREGRQVPRQAISDTQSMNFQKRKRKHVF